MYPKKLHEYPTGLCHSTLSAHFMRCAAPCLNVKNQPTAQSSIGLQERYPQLKDTREFQLQKCLWKTWQSKQIGIGMLQSWIIWPPIKVSFIALTLILNSCTDWSSIPLSALNEVHCLRLWVPIQQNSWSPRGTHSKVLLNLLLEIKRNKYLLT